MITSGCDVGSLTAKAVIMKDGEILAKAVKRAGTKPDLSATAVMDKALERAGISLTDIDCIVGTGYGKDKIPFAHKTESEITCHAMGAWWNAPDVRTVVDIGGQDAKAVQLDDKGRVVRYVYNDKCASGTGRFLEVMAEALEVALDEMGTISEKSTEKIKISNQCVIFAETEVISLVNAGKEVPDIVNALHRAMASRAASLAKGIGVKEKVAFTGGVAKNQGVYKALGEILGVELVMLNTDPQINGALGAALFAGNGR